MPEMALRFILSNPTVSTIIPGMRKLKNVESNAAASDAGPLPDELTRRACARTAGSASRNPGRSEKVR